MTAEQNGGRVTLPAETGQETTVAEMARKWGADHIRDSDGTELSDELLALGYDIYSTVCVVRADQEWPKTHHEQLPRKFLMTNRVTATGDTVDIPLMERYFDEKYEIDSYTNPKKVWEVIDRSTGELVDAAQWEYLEDKGIVRVCDVVPYHVYTVNFMVLQIWDSTSMYNHMTNNWTTEHVVSMDPYYQETYDHLMNWFDNWIETHPHTSVVRLTTLAYHFAIDSGPGGTTVFRDWLGYTDTITPPALDDFEKEMGYRLRAEDIVDQGYYNATNRVPSKQYRDWMAFIHKFVVRFGKDLADRAHKAGKKTATFWGDHWAGMEPYSPLYQEIGIDINIGACGDGVSLRRVADAPGPQTSEVRLYPYFFPDVFKPGGDPLGESVRNWVKIRRAMLRNPVDRIGYGGYLSLAAKFPEFVGHVEDLCNQFRTIRMHSKGGESIKSAVKVAVLTAWGSLRSWVNDKGVGSKFGVQNESNLLECLAGLPVEISFISFDDIEAGGIPSDVNVIINNGEAGSAWSGGRHWANETVVTAIREWVDNGGSFLGVGGPSGFEHQGRFFQLSDVMGVERETGSSLSVPGLAFEVNTDHFVLQDNLGTLEFGTQASHVSVCMPGTSVLAASGKHVLMAVRACGKGRAAYMTGLPYGLQNARLLLRTLLWCANREDAVKAWHSTNLLTDCAAFVHSGCMAVINNVDSPQTTTIYDGNGVARECSLAPYEMTWFEL